MKNIFIKILKKFGIKRVKPVQIIDYSLLAGIKKEKK